MSNMALKKIAGLLWVLGLKTAFSGTLDLGAQALYIAPDIDALNFRGQRTLANGALQYANYNPQYSWGYEIDGRYHLSEKYDATINGLHFEKSYHKVFGRIIGNEGNDINDLGSTIYPNLTIINAELGQAYSSLNNQIRVHGGVQYAHLSTNENSQVQIIVPILNSEKNVQRGYNGFGPRFGADLSHTWSSGFGVFGNTAMALLVGTQYSTTTFSSNYPPQRLLSSRVMVPELEGKLGVTYVSSVQQKTVKLNLGWMWTEYFKATAYDNYNLPLNISIDHPSLSLGFQGLYMGLTWVT